MESLSSWVDMSDFLSNAPSIIREASQSPLGVFSLMILVLAVLGVLFFRDASERTRIVIFVLMFLGVASFGVSISLVKSKEVAGPVTASVLRPQPQPPSPKPTASLTGERSDSPVKLKKVEGPAKASVPPPQPPPSGPRPTAGLPPAVTASIPRATHYTVTTSSDNTTVILRTPSGDAERHIALGQDRVQKIFSAADETWSLVVFKVRGQQQYRALPINLVTGSAQEDMQVPIPSVPDGVDFKKGEVVMSFRGGESQRLPLRD